MEVGTYIVADGFKLTSFPENHFFETGTRKRAYPDFCYTGRENYHLQLLAFRKCLRRGGSRLGLHYTTLTDGSQSENVEQIERALTFSPITSMRLPFLKINLSRPEPRNA